MIPRFLLDTNVISDLMAATPTPPVLAWAQTQPRESIFTSAVCEAEIRAGLACMPAGRRRLLLEESARRLFNSVLANRVLPFDRECAEQFGALAGERERRGRPGRGFDLMIASIARVHGAAVVTRNHRDFEHCGVEVVNPWRPAQGR